MSMQRHTSHCQHLSTIPLKGLPFQKNWTKDNSLNFFMNSEAVLRCCMHAVAAEIC